MLKSTPLFVLALISLPFLPMELAADGSGDIPADYNTSQQSRNTLRGFTGKITRDGVRLRLQPNLESPVVRELKKGDLIVVVGESEDFFMVAPPSKMKAYVYRPYVLDGIVEGSHVNVRLDPHLESPVIGQLNTGDRINGAISEKNAKWLEIEPPKNTVFYVSSDFVEKIGDAAYLKRYEDRFAEVNTLLNTTYHSANAELQKSFIDIDAPGIVEKYEQIIQGYPEFQDQVNQAKRNLAQFNEALLLKKIDHLEKKSASLEKNKPAAREIPSSKEITMNEERAAVAAPSTPSPLPSTIYSNWVAEKFASEVNAKMALWIPVEISYYEQWAADNDQRPIQEFYEEQQGQAVALKGILETYDRPVRNKPGDYLLVNRMNRLPIAYLYSTHINLQDKVGQEVTIKGALRPNNHFAYPAYFVIEAQ